MTTWMRAGLAALLAMMALAAPASAHPAGLTVGAGEAAVDITPAMLPLDGFGTVYDPLKVRVIVIGNGTQRAAIVVIDATSLFDDAVADARQAVSHATGVASGDIFVCASHTFSAPHMMMPGHLPPGMTITADQAQRATAYHDAIMAAVSKAATVAGHNRQPAEPDFATGVADVNVNRNVPMADGWWLGADDDGYSDKSLQVLSFDDSAHHPIAALVNYAVQSAVMNQSTGAHGKGVTADLQGSAMDFVESRLGNGVVSAFLTGAAGDQVPGYTSQRNVYDETGHFKTLDMGDAGHVLVDVQGERLGAASLRAVEAADPINTPTAVRVVSGGVDLPSQVRPKSLQAIHPTTSYHFDIDGTTKAPYSIMQIGDVAIVGVQAELSAVTGAYIRDHSPFAHTMVVTMVNGAAKYMPDAEAYRRITYEAMNSPYGAGSAETFANAIVRALDAMHGAHGAE